MQINPIQQVQSYNKSINNQPNFKGTYIVQIPHKAFTNPNNIQECTKLVSKQICKFRSKLDNFLNIFKQNLFCYPEKFSYMFSKKGMESCKLNNSVQWLRSNTGLPIADALRENYHSFFIYTKDDAGNVLKQITSVCKNTRAPKFLAKYSDPHMIATARTAKIGVELDKAMERQYKSAIVYEVENLADLKDVAQNIK
ncbi:hypothetical protein IKU74_02645 [bacterium]|nr:hypothetical protein [bacterium]